MEFSAFYDVFKELPNINFSCDVLPAISNMDGNKNLFLQFVRKDYTNPNVSFFDNLSLKKCKFDISTQDILESSLYFFNDEEQDVSILYDVDVLLKKIYSELRLDHDDKDSLVPIVNALSAQYIDVMSNGKDSRYFSRFNEKFKHWLSNPLKTRLSGVNVFDLQLEFAQESINRLNVLLKSLNKSCKKEELLECFDYDIFCMTINYSLFVDALNMSESGNLDSLQEEKNKKIVKSIGDYFAAVDLYCEENPGYDVDEEKLKKNPFYQSGDEKFSIDNFRKHFDKFLYENPKYDVIHDKPGLKASWEIIRSGEKDDVFDPVNPANSREKFPTIPTDEMDEQTRKLIISKNFLDESGAICKLRGINEFSGYVGYIYRNKKIIFEKFYDNYETCKVASPNATYVMTIDNFLSLSMLTKMEIIDKIKSDEVEGVSRIFHDKQMDNWKSKIKQAINGNDYTDEIIGYIDALVADRVVTREEGKKK